MAMKRNLKFGRGGLLLDGSGNPVRDGSGNPIMTGAGRQEADTQALMAKSKADLAADVQAKLGARKAKDDADFAAEDARSRTARAVAGTPAKKAPAKKTPIVTKEQLEKSGFTTLRDYMNAQRGLTRRDGKAPVMRDSAAARTATADARRPGPTRERAAGMTPMARTAPARPDASTSRGVRAAATKPAVKPTPKPAEARKPLAKSEGVQRQIDRAEAKTEERVELSRQRKLDRDSARAERDKASREALRSDPRQKELRAAREAREKMSPAERSAARGKKVKEFFGFAKGGTVSARADGIAKRGKTNCKMR